MAGSAVAKNTSSSLHLLRRQQQHLLQQNDSALPAKPLKFSKQAFRGSYFSLSNLLISVKYRLAVCPIQKSASTLLGKLVRKLEGHQFWYEDNWNNATGLVTAWQLGAQRLAAIFQDPKWTKAIFFRDPVDRLVSSYQQFLQSQYAYGRYAIRVRNGRNMSIPWPAFLTDVLEGGQTNIHWNPQTHYCGFHKYWKHYNFIGSFEQLEKHGRRLFDALGPTVWEEHGAKGWAIAGVKQIEGWHYWGEVDQINGQNVTKYVRNLTALHASVPKSSQQNDCIFCKNYASHSAAGRWLSALRTGRR